MAIISKPISRILPFVFLFTFSCNNPGSDEQISSTESGVHAELFTLLSSDTTGIEFTNQLHDDVYSDRNVLSYYHYYNGAGVAIGDINNDGLPDVFLAANEEPNRLYLNKGNMRFEDITEKANINIPKKDWSAGVTMADVNADGWLDIYVCQAGPYKDPKKRENLLLINNGEKSPSRGDNGGAGAVPTFSEKGEEYGLNDGNQSTQAAFFDYDKDGDLDCYVMNESKYVQVVLKTVYEDLKIKKNLEEASGNLFRNEGNHKFTKVTEEAGVLAYGFGLGLVIQDINLDGWPDIYVANDYSVPDFMYINNGDPKGAGVTFTDRTNEMTNQISFYGMGVDIADFNNDGYPEIAVVDMAFNDHVHNKTLMASMDTEGFWYYIKTRGYQYAYMFNSFQLNNGNGTFSNIAALAGVLSSDWSWAALLADFDNDGLKDYYVTNGFRRYSRDNDFRNKMKSVRAASGGAVPMNKREELYAMMPEIKSPNLMYHNTGDLTFADVTEDWGMAQPSYSNGAAYGDLDLDGDLDLIVNNIDHPVFVYRNNAIEINGNHYLRLKLEGKTPGDPVLNAKATIYYGEEKQYQEFTNVRGYEGSMEYALHFGLGKVDKINRLEVEWLNDEVSILENLDVNQTLVVKQSEATPKTVKRDFQSEPPFAEIKPKEVGIDFKHTENYYNDFEKEILLPHKQSTLGPKISVADANGDGLEDFFVGGAMGQSGVLFFQKPNGSFEKAPTQPWEIDANCEDMEALFFDADNNGTPDLYLVSGGGGEFEANSLLLQDRLYINFGEGKFFKVKNALPEMIAGGNCAKAADFDQDGDLDIFVGGAAVPGKYPYPSRSYLLRNDDKKFTDVTTEFAEELSKIGIVKDALWTDLNGDDYPDLVLAGEWMPITVFMNENSKGASSKGASGTLKNATAEWGTADHSGWYYSLAAADVDNDGDQDLIAGNVGLNTKFHASKKKPFNVFAEDFDKNGTCDIVLSKEYKGKLVPTRGRQCSSEQMPFITTKFPTYNEFAQADLSEILGEKSLDEALHLKATDFESVVLLNEGGHFKFQPLPNLAQVAPIKGIITNDFDGDGNVDIIIAGNMFETEVETPRYDAGTGLVLKGDGSGNFHPVPVRKSGFFARGNVKDIALLPSSRQGEPFILVANNDAPIQLFQLKGNGLLSLLE